MDETNIGGAAQKEKFVWRNKDGFLRNEHGVQDMHLALRAVCVVVAGLSALAGIAVFFLQSFAVIEPATDPVPFMYNGLLFALTAIGDSTITEKIRTKGSK